MKLTSKLFLFVTAPIWGTFLMLFLIIGLLWRKFSKFCDEIEKEAKDEL